MSFRCIDGTEVSLFENADTQLVAFVFIATDCPIANAYLPRLKQLSDDDCAKGVEFYLVHPTQDLTIESAKKHAEEFDISIPIVLDAEQEITKALGATVTPEAIVLRRDSRRPVYQGAIDNLFAGYGKKRPAATEHYLQNAIKEALSGSSVTTDHAKPIGCFISFNE